MLTHGGEIPPGNTCEGEDVSPARSGLERPLAGHVLVTAELLGAYEC